MDSTSRDQLLRVMWHAPGATPSSVWTVLDLARDPAIYAALVASRLYFECLYAGRVPADLQLVAPHLVELHPGHRLVNRLLDEGFGNHWGIFIKAPEGTGVRHHLRKLLTVRDESGRSLLFRFYDPRVLGVFLGTCDRDQLRHVFGPVHSFFFEVPDGTSVREFTLDHLGGLAETQIPIVDARTAAP